MKPPRVWILGIAILLSAPASTVRAQAPADPAGVGLNPFVGAFVFDGSELEDDLGREVDIGPIVGARVDLALSQRWWIEAGYGYASATVESSEFVAFPETGSANDLAIHLLHGAVDYSIGTDAAPTRLVLSAGAGLAFVDPELGDADIDFTVNLGAGFTHPVTEWIDFRGDARDHIAFCTGVDDPGDFSGCVEDELLNHWEFSGGLIFWLR